MLVNEGAKDLIQLSKRPINRVEEQYCKAMQEILLASIKFFSLRLKNLSSFNALKEVVSKYQKYPFTREIMNVINKIDAIVNQSQDYKGQIYNYSPLKFVITQFVKMKNPDDIYKLYPSISNEYEESKKAVNSFIDLNDTISKKSGTNPYEIMSNWMITRAGLFSDLTTEDLKEVANKSLSEYKYTYMPLPKEKLADYTFLVYFIMKLSNSDKDIILRAEDDIERYTTLVSYNREDGTELQKMVQNYLRGNDKNAVPEIIRLLAKFPELVKINNSYKREIKKVYRGVGVSNDVKKTEVMKQEKKRVFVATSLSKNTAENFALSIGHMTDKSVRNSDKGFIITYKVNSPDAVVLDTRVFGSVFGEVEILVDVSKCSVVKVEAV